MQESFDKIVDLAMQEPGRGHMRPVIEKELLHYDILFALSEAKLLDDLVFQGGTSLRLCHGAPRFSEDLDFAGGVDLDIRHLVDIKQCLEDYLGARYGLWVEVRPPAFNLNESQAAGPGITGRTAVIKWRISIQTAPKRPDIPRQRIKLEVANIPAYSRELRSLMRNYQFLPDGYSDVLIGVESLDEIMADKLVSLPSCDTHVRHRDIWDLRWLKQQGAEINHVMVSDKVRDYRERAYPAKLRRMIDQLDEIARGPAFRTEMGRFIPMDVQDRTLGKEGFAAFLASEVKGLLATVERTLNEPGIKPLDTPFRM